MTRIIFSGFGGQGVLTLGQIVASIALNKGLEVTWMPSYGAEMRGGTANCAVVVSDKPIGSPVVTSNIDILCAMNGPSIDKFLSEVRPGGYILVNSSIITEEIDRNDVNVLKIDATNIAVEAGSLKVANMVMLAGFLKASDLFTMDDIKQIMEQKFAQKNPKLIPLNLKAIEIGYEKIVE